MLLTEEKLVEMMLEVYDQKVQDVLDEIDLKPFPGQSVESAPLVTRDLKVRHGKSRLLYTVDSVSPKDITLRTPEGECFTVDAGEFEKEYELD